MTFDEAQEIHDMARGIEGVMGDHDSDCWCCCSAEECANLEVD